MDPNTRCLELVSQDVMKKNKVPTANELERAATGLITIENYANIGRGAELHGVGQNV